MCGRFSLRAQIDRLWLEFAAEAADIFAADFAWEPRFNIAPTQTVLAIRDANGRRELCKLRWGLIPSWSKELKIGASLINARSETVAEKPAFRAAFKRRRCLILADGFYEWPKLSGTREKIPHFITVGDEQVFAFAGLWETWRSDDGPPLETCSILTTSPNELMQPLHDRMPVILSPQNYSQWLNPTSDLQSLRELFAPYPANAMNRRIVSTYVNNVRHEGESCLASDSTLEPPFRN